MIDPEVPNGGSTQPVVAGEKIDEGHTGSSDNANNQNTSIPESKTHENQKPQDSPSPESSIQLKATAIIIPEPSVKFLGKAINQRIKIVSGFANYFEEFAENEAAIHKSLSKVSDSSISCFLRFFTNALFFPVLLD
jgi:hypothetical protein